VSRVLLLGAGGPAGENFCRAVQSVGHEVIGVDPDEHALMLSSAEEKIHADQGWSPATFLEADFVHAQPDQEVLRLATDPPGVATLVPDGATVRVAQDKHAMALWLEGLAPESTQINTPADVTAARRRWGTPVWFRARTGAGSLAALPVDNDDLGVAWLNFWESRGVKLMASRYLPGRNLSWTGVYSREGELVASATKERVELLGASRAPSGVSSTARVQRIIRGDHTAEIAKLAVAALTPNPRGVFMVDLREDEVGRPFVTEINAGRFGTTSNFFALAGGNLPAVLVALATGEEPPVTGEDCCEIGAIQVRNVDMGSRVFAGVPA
jgi:carbamoyl-phosphate synthase large subunit